MRRAWLGSMVLAAVALLSACSEGSVGAADWSLEGMSPDGRHLLVAVPFGGVASDCTRWEGAEITVTGDSVTVIADLWRRNGGACTADGALELIQIELEQPLGDRSLLGCGRDDCFTGFEPHDRGLVDPGRVVAAGDTVVVQGPTGVDLHDLDGALIASIDGRTSGEVIGLDDGTIVRTPSDAWQTAIAADAATGEDRWVASGWTAGVGADTAYLCRGGDGVGLTAVDPATGEDRWTSTLPCHFVELGGRVVAVTRDPGTDGGNRVVVGDAATGEVLVDRPIFDGIDDQVEAFDGVVVWNDQVVSAGAQADLVIIDGDGNERDRWTSRVGSPVGVMERDVLVSIDNARGVFGHELTSGAERWRVERLDPRSSFSFDEGSAWLLTDDRRSVRRLDAQTAQPMWETDIGLTTAIDVVLIDDLAVIVTTQALVAIDNTTGDLVWSVARPVDDA